MTRSEQIVFFKFGGLILLLFIAAIITEFGFILDKFDPKLIVLPIMFALLVSSLFGYAAVLRKRLQESSKAKSEFLSRMSHELRTPLNAVLGFSQLIKTQASKSDDQYQAENADEITVAGRHLLGLIEELLDLSTIEAGRIDLVIEDVNLGEVIEECLAIVQSLAKKHEIEITVSDSCKNSRSRIKADRVRIKEVLLNLLSNAVKYNRQNGWVDISCHDEVGERIRLTVADSGCGIPVDEIDNVFVPFSRGRQGKGAVEGIGIGLGITKKMVELMGGSIGCVSEVNIGSTFWVTILKSKH